MTLIDTRFASSLVRGRGSEANAHAPRRFGPGTPVDLHVRRRFGPSTYLVELAGSQRVVDSAVALQVGSIVHATVTRITDANRLELKYLDAEIIERNEEVPDLADAVNADPLAQLAERYAAALNAGDREVIEAAMKSVEQPELMAAGGLYLSKLALPVNAHALQALYAAQHWSTVSEQPTPSASVSRLDSPDVAELAQSLHVALGARQSPAATLPPTLTQLAQAAELPRSLSTGADTGDGRSQDQRELVRELLNVQDEGSVMYRYGVLPVIVADQLVELDLVYFRERRDAESANGLKRLVMTFTTATFGRVEVTAHAVGDRVSVCIRSQATDARELLAVHAQEVRELIERLGWNVEAVTYESSHSLDPAARHVIDHVLNADTLSRLV